MRGKADLLSSTEDRLRITPAYAGKSRHEWGVYRANQDHPRLCGEKSACMRVSLQWIGSPPPMRGKATYEIDNDLKAGITPAYAGKRLKTAVKDGVYTDHPRLCGEKTLAQNYTDAKIGSPPPMRGKVILVCNLVAVFRITPAYAGKRHLHHRHLGDLQDHPRLCGEKHNHVPQLIFLYGSPPPMRGKVP